MLRNSMTPILKLLGSTLLGVIIGALLSPMFTRLFFFEENTFSVRIKLNDNNGQPIGTAKMFTKFGVQFSNKGNLYSLPFVVRKERFPENRFFSIGGLSPIEDSIEVHIISHGIECVKNYKFQYDGVKDGEQFNYTLIYPKDVNDCK